MIGGSVKTGYVFVFLPKEMESAVNMAVNAFNRLSAGERGGTRGSGFRSMFIRSRCARFRFQIVCGNPAQTTNQGTVMKTIDTSKWFPIYYGNRFKVAIQVGRYKTQIESSEKFKTLSEAARECVLRNAKKGKPNAT